MVDQTNHVERSGQITVTVPEDDTGVLAAEETLYDALRELQDYRQTGDNEDGHSAICAIMRAYFQATDEIHEA